jgi:hypothetical protein
LERLGNLFIAGWELRMTRNWVAYALFGAGVGLLFVHTTLAVLWTLFGPLRPYPLITTAGPLALAPGLTPPLGLLLMLLAGRVYGAAAEGPRP